MKRVRMSPPRMVVLGFLLVILLGALLLNLPASTAEHIRPQFIDSLFTATSATCVTGLVVKDIASFFSPFGKLVILFLIQIGGLGIMTLSTMFAILLGKRLTISQNAAVQNALDYHKVEGLTALVAYIIIFTFSMEAIGAFLLYTRWIGVVGQNWLAVLKKAVFHSVSAFCNAGFTLFPDNLARFRSDWVVIATMSALIVIGGLGFIVFLDIPKFKFWRRNNGFIASHISLQTKIVFLVTLFLIIFGAGAIYLLESNNSLSGLSLKERVGSSIFTSITPRTAGFEVLPTGSLKPATLFLLVMLMFIGASPGGTGGGIKTVTFGIILISLFSMFYNRDRISIFGRTIPRQTYRKAVVIFLLSLAIVITCAFLLSLTEYGIIKSGDYFLNILFESTSAFGTVGLSTGITPHLTAIGKFILICTMFAGRIGPLTLALAIAMRTERLDYKYPEEKLMVG